MIPQEYEEELFKPFVQFGASEVVNGSGTGIGLALASSLAQLHNGVLSLDNDSVTNRFHLTLPIGDISILDKQAEIVESNEFFVSNIESELNTKKTINLVCSN